MVIEICEKYKAKKGDKICDECYNDRILCTMSCQFLFTSISFYVKFDVRYSVMYYFSKECK